jgi:hypothetical protein
MKQTLLRDIVGLVGAALIALGAGMIYRPAGVLVGGVLLVSLALFGFSPEKKAGD